MPTFLKQYGERRTGTNYLRFLVQANFQDVTVLMHILGDKHAPPVDLGAVWDGAQGEPDPPLAFVSRATFDEHSPSLHVPDDGHRESVTRLAGPIASAFCAGTLGYLVAVKDPYAWSLSIGRYQRWPESGNPEELELLCASFNSLYAAWMALPACEVVRYEDMLSSPAEVLDRIAARFGGRRRRVPRLETPAPMAKMIWDYQPIRHDRGRFDRSYYTERRYLDALQARDRDIVTRTIDWALFAPLGYEPLAARAAHSG